MSISTVMSVTSFSVVLGEMFAAVGLSTTVPAGVITLARLAKALPSNSSANTTALNNTKNDLSQVLDNTPAKTVTALVDKMSVSLDELQLLLPKTAHIHADFTYEGRDAMSAQASVGAMVNVVSVNAGFSALYESKSTNKITLDVDFVNVNIPL